MTGLDCGFIRHSFRNAITYRHFSVFAKRTESGAIWRYSKRLEFPRENRAGRFLRSSNTARAWAWSKYRVRGRQGFCGRPISERRFLPEIRTWDKRLRNGRRICTFAGAWAAPKLGFCCSDAGKPFWATNSQGRNWKITSSRRSLSKAAGLFIRWRFFSCGE